MTLTQERLKELLHYDPETGVFTWLVRSAHRVQIGDIAGSRSRKGYITIRIDGVLHRAHRLAWLYVYGHLPVNGVDHRFGVKDDNRIGELREATQGENLQNQRRPRTDNRCGFLGVIWDKQKSKYRATIKVSGRQKHLGFFLAPELAHAAYLSAKAQMHPFSTLRGSNV